MTTDTQQIIENIIYSFELAKRDIYSFGSRISVLNHNLNSQITTQNKINREIQLLKEQIYQLRSQLQKRKKPIQRKKKSIVKAIAKTVRPAPKKFVASKTSNKIHLLSCVFAKNIRPKRKLYFASKIKPLNHGFKVCECVKRI